jgi:RNA exonuclease 1
MRRQSFPVTGVLSIYFCCKSQLQADGCQINAFHVTGDVDPRGFVKTIASKDVSKEKVFALDCEMCYTTNGIELTRVTVIDEDGITAYESFVKPDNMILDYNTRFV